MVVQMDIDNQPLNDKCMHLLDSWTQWRRMTIMIINKTQKSKGYVKWRPTKNHCDWKDCFDQGWLVQLGVDDLIGKYNLKKGYLKTREEKKQGMYGL